MLLKSKIYSGRKRGRPKGILLKKPEKKATIQMRLSQELWDWLQPHLRKNETYSETMLRLLVTKEKNEQTLKMNLAVCEYQLRDCQHNLVEERRNNFNAAVEKLAPHVN